MNKNDTESTTVFCPRVLETAILSMTSTGENKKPHPKVATQKKK